MVAVWTGCGEGAIEEVIPGSYSLRRVIGLWLVVYFHSGGRGLCYFFLFEVGFVLLAQVILIQFLVIFVIIYGV